MKRLHKILTETVNIITEVAGKPYTFALSIAVIVAWFIVGALSSYSEMWFNVLNILVFLAILFVIQSTQNTDTKAMQDKLDEIIQSLPEAEKKKEGEEKRMKHDEND